MNNYQNDEVEIDLRELFFVWFEKIWSVLICTFIGMIVAAVVGYICIKTMLVVVRNKKFKYFSYYCAVVGLVAIIASFVIK